LGLEKLLLGESLFEEPPKALLMIDLPRATFMVGSGFSFVSV
jgi:hypothetical protein